MHETNWAGNHVYTASEIRRPRSVDETAELVASARSIRALGSRHSFTDIIDADLLLDLSGLPRKAQIAEDRRSVALEGPWTYSQLAPVLQAEGLALHNLASLPHISIAGAIATGTHGSGDANGNLATAVASLDLITASGETVVLDEADPRFAGAVVSLGALGVTTKLTLSVEPSFEIRQHAYEGVGLERLIDSFDDIFGSAYSVSAFTTWVGDIEQIWVKERLGRERASKSTFDTMRAAVVDRHPIIGLDAGPCTPQLGVIGPWNDRLPHFAAGFEPSAGDEIQSEFFVPRVEAAPAIEALQRVGTQLADVLMVCEIRTIAGDDLWMSPHHECDSVAFHFTWRRDPAAVDRAVRVAEEALWPFAPRPHWGKVFTQDVFDAPAVYRCFDDFERLRRELDPTGTFSNDWTKRVLGS